MSTLASKDWFYSKYGVRGCTSFYSTQGGDGFFTPFKGFSDFRAQLKQPIAMPIVCLVSSVQECLSMLMHLTSTVIDIATLNLRGAKDQITKAKNCLVSACSFLMSAVVDTLWQLAALPTRTVSTAASLATGAVSSVASLFSPKKDNHSLSNLLHNLSKH